ncbi:phospholipase D family protein [Microbulbifer halophilus]|uniref:Phospholipase D family protein n=1 Tax=Microbulbifer halophilus TaxID=453963 RepID=A0ABW5EGS7_9GAMM|nr:phospholipase D family protein [Microbulbifer halophilus]MCW8127298.1 phospholipase D family protein [Microbulbifer halophilus]
MTAPDAPSSNTLPPDPGSRLTRAIDREVRNRAPDQSGCHLLSEGLSAFATRVMLIREASISLDLQYYIYSGDTSGRIITGLLLVAADRGVRVRLLVDDLGTRIVNPRLLALDHHPNIEVRVFNPVEGHGRMRRGVAQALDLGRINHRMHNKLMVADGVAAVTGGRNIADGYFSSSRGQFLDVDVLAVGALVGDASAIFDDYWNSTASVPAPELLIADRDRYSLGDLRTHVCKYLSGSHGSELSRAAEKSTFSEELTNGRIPFEWGSARLFADPPQKATDPDSVPIEEYPGYQLEQIIRRSRRRLQISNPYLIPGEDGVRLFTGLLERGVQVEILTNGLATNDVAAVHGAYSRYRKPLLRAGVQLWELRPVAQQKQRKHWFRGESQASLHAKTFVLDKDRGFVGSINLDSRSTIRNTEIGLLIDSPAINRQLHGLFQAWVAPESAWRLALRQKDRIRWYASGDGGGTTVDEKEPKTSTWQRFLARALSWLPIESQI